MKKIGIRKEIIRKFCLVFAILMAFGLLAAPSLEVRAMEFMTMADSVVVGTKVKQSKSYVLLPIGEEKQIFLTEKEDGERVEVEGTKVRWKTSNKNIAKVTKTGLVKAKKEGTCYIKGSYAGENYYWAINVTTPVKYKVIIKAKKIGKYAEYSQANRMDPDYYDCSSLVWRAYSSQGIYIGGRYNRVAPVAADECKILVGQGKKIKGALSKRNIQKRKLRAGDLFFETGEDNGRYKGIYHVEMFTGYDIQKVKSSGKVIYTTTWANRKKGYYPPGTKSIVCRP